MGPQCAHPPPSGCRDLPHRVTEADRRPRSPRRVPRQQRGGHQCAAHQRCAAAQQAAVLPEPVSARPAVRAPLQAQVLCPSATGPAPCQASCLAGPRKSGVGRTLLSRQGARSPACTSAGRAADRQGRPGSRRLGRRAGPSSLLLQTPGSERSPPLCLVGWPQWSPLPTRSPPAGCRLKTRLGPGRWTLLAGCPPPTHSQHRDL